MSADQPDAAAGRSWTVLELLRWTTDHLASKGIDSARLDAECLLAEALGTSRLGLYVDFEKPVTPDERSAYRDLVRRRATDRVPVSQILGSREFWSLPLRVTSDVLTPRPETETLVSAALDRLSDPDGDARILEIGTGSGAIALALATERPRARIVATDISSTALQIAAENAEQLHLRDRVCFLEGDLFGPVEDQTFDLVVSNPPYLARSESEGLPPELAHEPDVALFGGADGLEVLLALVDGVGSRLESGGWVLVELDPRQVEPVSSALGAAGFDGTEVLRDLARRPRVVAAQKR